MSSWSRLRKALVLGLLVLPAACGGSGTSPPTDGAGPTTTAAASDGSDTSSVAEDGASALAAQCPVEALEEAADPVEITMWHSMQVELETALTALVERYNAEQEQVRVELVFQGSYNDSLDKYLAALRGGTRPTIIQLADVALQLGIDSGSFVPAQACVEASGYDLGDHLERVVAAHTVDGVLHPMPFNVATPLVYANMAMLREAGLEQVPDTLEGVRAASQAVVDAGVAPAGLALTTSPGLIEQWFALADQPYVDAGNGRSARASELLIDTPFGEELFGWLSAIVDDGLATSVGPGDNAEHFIAVATGEAAMTIDTSAALRSVLVVARDFPDVEVAVGPMPSLGERLGGVLVGGGALWIDAETDDGERAAAWDFLTWLNEPEQQATWHAGTGYLPISASAAESPEVQALWAAEPEFRVAYDQLLDGPETAATAGPVVGNHPLVRQRAIQPALERMWIQGADPTATLAQAKAEGDAVIADYTRRVGG